MWRQAASIWQKSQNRSITGSPMWRTSDEESACWWPTPSLECGPFTAKCQPRHCELQEGAQVPTWFLFGPRIWGDKLSGGSVWTIWYPLNSWYASWPWHCCTSGALPETGGEAGTRSPLAILPPSLTDWYADQPAFGNTSRAITKNPAAFPIHPWLEASVNRPT